MRFVLSGASGLIGGALTASLRHAGHDVVRLVRPESRAVRGDEVVRWNPVDGSIDRGGLERSDAVIHLAGENLVAGLWTRTRRDRILNSRVQGTQLLASAIASLQHPPSVLISASAVGYYGDRADVVLTESSAAGEGFLADVCRRWEQAADPARNAGIRVVHARIGVVLAKSGGALAKMLPAFRLGLGGRLGSGRQWMSWIAHEDVIGGILHAIATPEIRGPVNLVAPHPITNAEFTRLLGAALNRPTLFAVPSFVLTAALGDLARETVLASQRALPSKLTKTGFIHRFPHLDAALRAILA